MSFSFSQDVMESQEMSQSLMTENESQPNKREWDRRMPVSQDWREEAGRGRPVSQDWIGSSQDLSGATNSISPGRGWQQGPRRTLPRPPTWHNLPRPEAHPNAQNNCVKTTIIVFSFGQTIISFD